jgi:predicted HTH domain antitoxin
MRSITLTIPDFLDIDDHEAAILFAAMLYEQGKVSLGDAAELAGLSKRTFTEQLGQYNISLFNFSVEELSRDIRNA